MSGATGTWDTPVGLWDRALGFVDGIYNHSPMVSLTGPIGLSIPEITVNGIDRSQVNAKLAAEIEAKEVLKMAVVFAIVLSATVFVAGKMKGK